MSQWIGFAVGAAFVGLFGWALAWGMRYNTRRNEQERRQQPVRERRARELGWRYDGTPDGDIRYRFEGYTADSLRWTMKFDSDAGSSSSTPKLLWQTSGLKSQRIELMLGSRSYVEGLTSGAGRKVIGAANFVLGRLVGGSLQDMGEFVAAAKVVSSGRGAAEGFAVASRDGALARRLLHDPELSRLLTSWPREMPKGFVPARSVSAQLDREGLKLTVNIDGPPMAVCEHLAKLGEALAVRLRDGRGLVG